MKTFKKTSLPKSIKYNGETYTYNATISGSMMASGTNPKKVIEAVKSTGKKAVLVEVLSSRLKKVIDLHGKQYEPTKWIYTN
jgi:orotate phosphoribosyltransferase-like protein